jgi:deoxyribose-phosphate aldolase
MDFSSLTEEKIAKMIDYGPALATPYTEEDVRLACAEAIKYNFKLVVVVENFIPLVKKLLKGTDIITGGIFSYPLGNICTEAKIAEIKNIIDKGAEAIDGVLPLSALKAGDISFVKNETEKLVSIARELKKDIEIKFMIEISYFNDEEIVTAAKIVKDSGADFIKTGTGWAPWGPSIHQIKLLRQTVGPDFGVKASGMEVEGPINNFLAYVNAGANRFGLISAVRVIESFKILKENQNRK